MRGAGFGLNSLYAGGFRRLRAASYFALGGKVTKTPPGNGSGWTLRVHIRLIPGPHYGGRVPESQQRISGAQNLSGCSKFLPGHWALTWWEIEADAVSVPRLALPTRWRLVRSRRAGLGPAPTKEGMAYRVAVGAAPCGRPLFSAALLEFTTGIKIPVVKNEPIQAHVSKPSPCRAYYSRGEEHEQTQNQTVIPTNGGEPAPESPAAPVSQI